MKIHRQFRFILFYAIGMLLTSCITPTSKSTATPSVTIVDFYPIPWYPYLTPTPIATLPKQNIPTLEARPNFIEAITPREYSIIPLSFYIHTEIGVEETLKTARIGNVIGFASSICVRPFLEPLVQTGDNFLRSGKIQERMELWIDNNLMEKHNFVLYGLAVIPGPDSQLGDNTNWVEGADYCWKAPLTVGQHKAIFYFQQTSGDIQEYTWYFEISE